MHGALDRLIDEYDSAREPVLCALIDPLSLKFDR